MHKKINYSYQKILTILLITGILSAGKIERKELTDYVEELMPCLAAISAFTPYDSFRDEDKEKKEQRLINGLFLEFEIDENFYSQENLIKYTEGFFNKFTIDLDKFEAKLSKREADYLLTNILPKEVEKVDQMISNLVKNPKKWDKKIRSCLLKFKI